MKIVIPGGSGQVGTLLARKFVADGHEVVVLSRKLLNTKTENTKTETAKWKVVEWDGETLGDWTKVIDGSDVVINLAGVSVNCRYTQQNRRRIKESRINSTRVVGEAIASSNRPPKVWLQASTATIYAHRYDQPNDEETGILGGSEENAPDTWNFSIDVAKSWEQVTNEAIVPQTRKVLLRSAMTMSPDRNGVFDVLLGLTRWGLGGTIGNGRQYVSWIHEEDFVQSVYWIIEHEALEGPVNLSAPNPLPYAEFMKALREAWGIKLGLPASQWMLEIGTFFIRSESELVLKSRRVIPTRLLESGFQFKFESWPAAAKDLCERWKEMRQS